MKKLRPRALIWAGTSLGLLAGSAALGWVDSTHDLATITATTSATAPAQTSALALPHPPSIGAQPPAKPEPDPARSSIPPPGGYPVDVMQEMWEASLLIPRKLSDTPLTAENWFITGVFTRDGEQQVIVQRGSDPKPHFHKVGDTLPGGAQIAWVRPNVIGLTTRGDQRIALPLTQPLRAAATSAP